MKTKKQVIQERPEYKTLINAVINRIGMDSVQDVNNHGIDGGFGGFIYTADTVAFFKRHKKDILQLLKDMSFDMGQNWVELVGGFNCLKYYDYTKGDWSDKEGFDAICSTIYGNKVDDMVANALSWFAAEEVCRMFEE